MVTAIAATDPELIYYPVFIAEEAPITAQAREIGPLNDVNLAGGDAMMAPEWIRAAGPENAEGVYLSAADLDLRGDGYEQTVLKPYRQRWGEPTSIFHAHAFDAANLVFAALEQVAIVDSTDGTTYMPRTALRDRLVATSGYEGVAGELTCNDDGDCNVGAAMDDLQVVNSDFRRVWSLPAGS